MTRPLRIALIGLGRHGLRYARHLAAGDVSDATLDSVWTRDAAKRAQIAQELGVTAVPSVQTLTAGNVDAVVAAVPAGMHAEVVEACAKTKRPLLLEKPISRSVQEGTDMCERMEAAGAPFMLAQTLRFDPLVTNLRARLSEIGTITGLSFEQRLEPRGLAWEDDPEVSGGGVLMQTAIHTLDAARFVSQAEVAKVLHASTRRVHYKHNEDVGLVHLELAGGPALTNPILADVRVSKIGGSRHMRFAVFGTAGGLEADFIARTLTLTVDRQATVTQVAEVPTVVATAGAFVQSLLHNQPCPIPARDALASLALVEAAYRAAA